MCRHMDLVDALLDVGHNVVFAVDFPTSAIQRLGFEQAELEKIGAIKTNGETFQVNRLRVIFTAEAEKGFAETPRFPPGSKKRGKPLVGGGGNWATQTG